MMKSKALAWAVGLLAATLASSNAQAAIDMRITEIWPGGLDGTESTSDWFELTNVGDMAATGIDGAWFYDDNSNDPTSNDPLIGINTIAPGESVIYVVSWEDDYATPVDAITAFTNMWGAPAGNLGGLQIGYIPGGGGLGGGGDRVNVYDGNTAGATLLADGEYLGPATEASFVSGADAVFNPGGGLPLVAQVGVLGAYAGNLPASDAPGIGLAIGSPGVVPEPSSCLLLVGSILALLGIIRK